MSNSVQNLRSEHGFGLLFAIFALGIVGVLGFTMMTNGMIDMTVSDNFRSKSTAFYAADAGIEQTLIDLKVDNAWVGELVDTATWTATTPASSTLLINGHTVTLQLDQTGAIVPGFYALGSATTLGKGSYTREIYLPPSFAAFDDSDCSPGATSSSGKSGSSKDSTSKSGKSGGSKSDSGKSDSGKSGGSKSGGSKSGKSGGSKSGGSGSFADSIGGTLAWARYGLASVGLAEFSGSSSKSGKSKSGKSGKSGGSGGSNDPCDLLNPSSGSTSSGSGKSGGSGSDSDSGAGSKVTICHVPPGNPSAAHTLTIAAAAVGAHLGNHSGDALGACGSTGTSSGSSSGCTSSALLLPAPSDAPPSLLASMLGSLARMNLSLVPAGLPTASVRPMGPAPESIGSKSGKSGDSKSGDSKSGGSKSGESGDSKSGGSKSGKSGGSASGKSGGSSSGSSSADCPEPEDLPAVIDVEVSIRSTGTGNQVEQGNQVLLADLVFTLDDTGTVIEIKVRNWREDR